MMRRRVCVAFALAACVQPALAANMPPTERSRVDRLIRYVESRTDVQFVRNGNAYDSREAAKFLRGKLDAKGDGITTAKQFIEQIASKSSTSGEPYLIRFADGRTQTAYHFLAEELRRIDAPK